MKKTYERPALTTRGDIRAITQGSGALGFDGFDSTWLQTDAVS